MRYYAVNCLTHNIERAKHYYDSLAFYVIQDIYTCTTSERKYLIFDPQRDLGVPSTDVQVTDLTEQTVCHAQC